MEHQTGSFTAPDGVRLFTQRWTPPANQPINSNLVLVHGYGEHSGRYQHVAKYFVERGYAVHAMDSRGHGKSAAGNIGYFEKFAALPDDLAGFIKHVSAESPLGRPLFVLGHSMGGLVTVSYLIRHQPPPTLVRGAVTSGAYLDAGYDVPAFAKVLVRNVLAKVLPRQGTIKVDSATLSRDKAVIEAYDKDPLNFHAKTPARVAGDFIAEGEFARANLAKITVPMFCVHGKNDPLVRPETSRWIYEGISSTDKTLKLYDGLLHEILNEPEREQVMADIADWLAARLAAQPRQ